MISKNILCRCGQLLLTFVVIVLGLNRCYCDLEYIQFPKGMIEEKQLL